MNIEHIKQVYIQSGFEWHPHLNDFMQHFGGKEIEYLHPLSKEFTKARLYRESQVLWGNESRGIYLGGRYLGESVTPVGDAEDGYVQLLLSISGVLIGFATDNIVSWSNEPAPNWRDSMERMLRGVEDGKIVATMEMEDDPDWDEVIKQIMEEDDDKKGPA